MFWKISTAPQRNDGFLDLPVQACLHGLPSPARPMNTACRQSFDVLLFGTSALSVTHLTSPSTTSRGVHHYHPLRDLIEVVPDYEARLDTVNCRYRHSWLSVAVSLSLSHEHHRRASSRSCGGSGARSLRPLFRVEMWKIFSANKLVLFCSRSKPRCQFQC